MKAIKFLSLSLLLLTMLCTHGLAQQARLVTIPNSEHRQLHSKLAGNDYDIYIHYPAGYDTAKRKFPVLYVVDGDNDFSPSLEYLGLLMAEYHIPEPILIAGALLVHPATSVTAILRQRPLWPWPKAAERPYFLLLLKKN